MEVSCEHAFNGGPLLREVGGELFEWELCIHTLHELVSEVNLVESCVTWKSRINVISNVSQIKCSTKTRTFINGCSKYRWCTICRHNDVMDITNVLLQAIMDNDCTTTLLRSVVSGLRASKACDNLTGPTDQVEFHLSMHKRHTIPCVPSQNVVPAREMLIFTDSGVMYDLLLMYSCSLTCCIQIT